MGKPLIFSKTTLHNLFSKSPCKMYPAVPAHFYERTTGHIENDIEDCILCGACMRSCPSNAITVDKKAGTWQIERFKCVTCLNCVRVCPKSCLTNVNTYMPPATEPVIDLLHKVAED